MEDEGRMVEVRRGRLRRSGWGFVEPKRYVISISSPSGRPERIPRAPAPSPSGNPPLRPQGTLRPQATGGRQVEPRAVGRARAPR
eukprot:7526702-Pyramimonas_sp.AAC.1